MSWITIDLHPQLAASLLADRAQGARAVASLSRQAIRIVQACGRRIAYAPVVLPNGTGCAMSAHGGVRGVVIKIDAPGTIVPGRGVVVERERAARRR